MRKLIATSFACFFTIFTGFSFADVSANNVNQQKNIAQQNNQVPVFLETQISPKAPYVQSQVIYTVKIFFQGHLINARLTPPSAPDLLFSPLDNDKQYNAQRQGKNYHVVEKHYVLIPETSGNIVIHPPELYGEITDGNIDINDPFTVFDGKPIRIAAPTITLEVKAKPASVNGWWFPAEDVTIEQSWSQDLSVNMGEPITRTILIQAVGAPARQIPNIPSMTLDGVNIYPDQANTQTSVSNDSLLSIRQQKFAYVPTQAGNITIPALEIPWWNTKTNRAEVATLPAQTIKVLAVANQNNEALAPTPQTQNQLSSSTKTEPSHWFWPFSVFLLLVLWVFTVFLFWNKRRTPKIKNALSPSKQGPWQKKLKQACDDNDAHKAAQALMLWATDLWQSKKSYSLLDIAKQIHNESLQQAIKELDSFLYKENINHWDGEFFWEIFNKTHKQALLTEHAINDPIAPMNPR